MVYEEGSCTGKRTEEKSAVDDQQSAEEYYPEMPRPGRFNKISAEESQKPGLRR